MHEIVVSEGIVLGKRSVGEANLSVSILTKELGLVRAAARSARVEQSKLRYGLELQTQGRFSFVRGRHEWRLTGVERTTRPFAEAPAATRAAAARVARLFSRLVAGQEPMPELYTTLKEGLASLAAAPEEHAPSVECVLVLRTLSHLGYLPHTPELAPFIDGDFFSGELAAAAARERALLIRAINSSLHASGL